MADKPIVAVAGAVSVDMSLRNPPLDWYGSAGADSWVPGIIKRLDAPVQMVLGGNGGVPAYVMAKSGVRARLSAPVGTDIVGQLTRRWLEDAGVELLGAPTASTMFGLAAVDDDGRRLGCLQYPGPPVDWLAASQCDDAEWLLIGTHAQATRADYENTLAALEHARRAGRRTAYDCGVGWRGRMPPADMYALWQHTDLVIGTNDELGDWTGTDDPRTIARAVLDHGPRQVTVKLGAEGAAWQGRDEPFEQEPAPRIERPNLTIGAGDSFNGGMLTVLAKGGALGDAVAAGQTVAAAVVESGRGVMGWVSDEPASAGKQCTTDKGQQETDNENFDTTTA